MKNAKRTMSKGKRHGIYSGIMHMVSRDGANNEPVIDWWVWNGPDAFTPKGDPFAAAFTDDDDNSDHILN